MSRALSDSDKTEVLAWVERQIGAGRAYAGGYQGQVYRFDTPEWRLVIKVAAGRGPLLWLRRWMLAREARAYERLAGFRGAPQYHGLLRGRYLVLDYVDGVRMHRQHVTQPDVFFPTLLDHIKELHRRGVAHADLKRKDNLLIVDGRTPCLIDFGAAIVRKPGWHPLNHLLFNLARQFDYNAWVKLKHRYVEQAPAEDLAYFRMTRIERVARAIKRAYLRLKPGRR